eukprot:scaffold26382_cov117-Cylindrotheca_fusiformis.AAC.1
MRNTPLALSKTLVVLKHFVIYGSEKCVNSAYGIGKFIETLQNYNTVLLAHERRGAGGLISRIKGGGVDRGEPVREAAKQITVLLSNINELQKIRIESASKDSLVPVGSNKVGFVTDEVRLSILKKRMVKQQQIELKSNLAKSEGGFGGGYNARDGKAVVGAAHGIEEMVKIASRQKKKFSDDGTPEETEDDRILKELVAEARAAKEEAEAAKKLAEANLLSEKNATPAGEIDLLDFGSSSTDPPVSDTATSDLLGGHDLLGSYSPDPSNLVSTDPFSPTVGSNQYGGGNDLLGSLGSSNDPFGATVVTSMVEYGGIRGTGFNGNPGKVETALVPTLQNDQQCLQSDSREQKPKNGAMVTPNEDRFAALDALAANFQTLGHGDASSNDDSSPWVMGGMVGSGLGEPIAPAPGAPPPPPPP